MRIRCERCATVYELDDRRLPARGALVKCTRCQHVFRAAPPGTPAAPVASPTAAGTPASPPAETATPAPPPEEKTALFGFSAPGTEEKTERLSAAPTPAGGAPAPAAEARAASARPVEPPRRGSPVLWVVLVVLVLAAIGAAAWLALRKRPDPAAAARRAVLEHLLARDDRSGLERAADMGTDELAPAPQALGALALALLATDAADDLRPLEARERVLTGELRREETVRAAGWRERRDEIAARLGRAREEAGAIRIRRDVLLARSRAALAMARAAEAADGDLLRAQVALAAAVGDGNEVVRLSGTPAGSSARDPWVEMVRASVAGDVAALEGVVERQRALVRARVLLARALHGQGKDSDAVARLDEVIAGDPEHERAKAWKAEILAPPPATVSQVSVPGRAPPVTEKGFLPRLKPRG